MEVQQATSPSFPKKGHRIRGRTPQRVRKRRSESGVTPSSPFKDETVAGMDVMTESSLVTGKKKTLEEGDAKQNPVRSETENRSIRKEEVEREKRWETQVSELRQFEEKEVTENECLIAVLLHLFHDDTLPEMVRYVWNVRQVFPRTVVLVTVRQDLQEEKRVHIQSALVADYILPVENKGVDVYAFLQSVRYLRSRNVYPDFILKIHSKKSCSRWRKKLIEPLVSAQNLLLLAKIFEEDLQIQDKFQCTAGYNPNVLPRVPSTNAKASSSSSSSSSLPALTLNEKLKKAGTEAEVGAGGRFTGSLSELPLNCQLLNGSSNVLNPDSLLLSYDAETIGTYEGPNDETACHTSPKLETGFSGPLFGNKENPTFAKGGETDLAPVSRNGRSRFAPGFRNETLEGKLFGFAAAQAYVYLRKHDEAGFPQNVAGVNSLSEKHGTVNRHWRYFVAGTMFWISGYAIDTKLTDALLDDVSSRMRVGKPPSNTYDRTVIEEYVMERVLSGSFCANMKNVGLRW